MELGQHLGGAESGKKRALGPAERKEGLEYIFRPQTVGCHTSGVSLADQLVMGSHRWRGAEDDENRMMAVVCGGPAI